jgi:predicted dehydrogenase
MKSLIVGLGIGSLYKSILEAMGGIVVTADMDPNKNANYRTITEVLRDHNHFDTVHICTPNFTHYQLAELAAAHAKIVFIEKPGFQTSTDLEVINQKYPSTRFMMVKNNMWRTNVNAIRDHVRSADVIKINWINHDRVPNPGSWFTTKQFAWGGVSRDLMPHMLSWFIALNVNYDQAALVSYRSEQRHSLDTINDTAYGVVNKKGQYNVDDWCRMVFEQNNKQWVLEADWRSLGEEDIGIIFVKPDTTVRIPLGLCPEEAYADMIIDAYENIYNSHFWNKQIEHDVWIIDQVNKL